MNCKRGFTLVELLTVIAIIGILAAIIIPVVGKVRESAKMAACMSNLHQIGVAINLYVADNKGTLPPGTQLKNGNLQTWTGALSPYLAGRDATGAAQLKIPQCKSWPEDPNYRDPATTPNAWESGYTMIKSVNGQFAANRIMLENFAGEVRALMNSVDYPNKQVAVLDGPSNCQDFLDTTGTVVSQKFSLNSLARHGGRTNAVFWDGHVQTINNEDTLWDAMNDPKNFGTR